MKHPGAVLMEEVNKVAELTKFAPVADDMSVSFQIYDFDWPKDYPMDEFSQLIQRGQWFTMTYKTAEMIKRKVRACLPAGYGDPTNSDLVGWALSAEMDFYKKPNSVGGFSYYIV